MDSLSPEQRSDLMRKVRQRDTAPEMVIRRALHNRGFRYQLHRRDLPGSPDLVFPRTRRVVFVHGCFWHVHPGCRRATTPKSTTDYWLAKLAENQARDVMVRTELEAAGWRVHVVWECEARSQTTVDRLCEFLICSDTPS